MTRLYKSLLALSLIGMAASLAQKKGLPDYVSHPSEYDSRTLPKDPMDPSQNQLRSEEDLLLAQHSAFAKRPTKDTLTLRCDNGKQILFKDVASSQDANDVKFYRWIDYKITPRLLVLEVTLYEGVTYELVSKETCAIQSLEAAPVWEKGQGAFALANEDVSSFTPSLIAIYSCAQFPCKKIFSRQANGLSATWKSPTAIEFKIIVEYGPGAAAAKTAIIPCRLTADTATCSPQR